MKPAALTKTRNAGLLKTVALIFLLTSFFRLFTIKQKKLDLNLQYILIYRIKYANKK